LSELVFVQVLPPSSDLKRPPSRFSIKAQTRSEFNGETAIPIIPTNPSGSPLFLVISFHVSPPSVDFQRPDPSPPLSRL